MHQYLCTLVFFFHLLLYYDWFVHRLSVMFLLCVQFNFLFCVYRKYMPLVSIDQRQRYKDDFNAEYDEYRLLHARVESITRHFTQLDSQCRKLAPGTKEYQVNATFSLNILHSITFVVPLSSWDNMFCHCDELAHQVAVGLIILSISGTQIIILHSTIVTFSYLVFIIESVLQLIPAECNVAFDLKALRTVLVHSRGVTHTGGRNKRVFNDQHQTRLLLFLLLDPLRHRTTTG